MANINVTPGQNGSNLSAAIGDTLIIELPETPGTGYRWTVVDLPAEILSITGDEFQAGKGVAIGGGGLRVFRYLTTARGNANLRLALVRAWESKSPKETMSFRLSVN